MELSRVKNTAYLCLPKMQGCHISEHACVFQVHPQRSRRTEISLSGMKIVSSHHQLQRQLRLNMELSLLPTGNKETQLNTWIQLRKHKVRKLSPCKFSWRWHNVYIHGMSEIYLEGSVIACI